MWVSAAAMRRGSASNTPERHHPSGNGKERRHDANLCSLHPTLVASIAACVSLRHATIPKDDGAHYSKEGLGNAFREAIVAAGIPVSKKGSDEKAIPPTVCARRARPSQRKAVLPN